MASATKLPSISVRAARTGDAARLSELAGQLGYPSTPEQTVERLRGILPDPQHAVFVAEQGGEVTGWLHVFILRTLESGERAEIGGLVVDESRRSQGAGRLLLGRAEQWAKEKGCAAIGLRSNVIRERAHRFYESLGYRHSKTQKAFRKPL